jgi:hypothetical protein
MWTHLSLGAAIVLFFGGVALRLGCRSALFLYISFLEILARGVAFSFICFVQCCHMDVAALAFGVVPSSQDSRDLMRFCRRIRWAYYRYEYLATALVSGVVYYISVRSPDPTSMVGMPHFIFRWCSALQYGVR